MKSIPRLRFAHLPTPVEPLPRLSAFLKGPSIMVKRDDQTGLALGGNKTRKLEFLIAEAQANGARTLITAGSGQSNHCRQTAAAAARFGYSCILVLVGKPLEKEEKTLPSGNLLLNHLFGAKIVWTTRAERDLTLQQTFEKAWSDGRRPYLIPYGGSNSTGAVAYAFAMKELLTQIHPDWIIFPSSSGGTQAGLVLGAQIFGFKGNILGISVDEPVNILQDRVATLVNSTSDLLGERINISNKDIMVNADYLGDGYGIMGKPEQEAIRLFAMTEGLLLDPVYTGRAAAGMIDLIRNGFIKDDHTVLFWHTGGTPAIFADQYREKISGV